MVDLENLAKRYYAYETADKSGFQRQARILQSMWRTEQGFSMGTRTDKTGDISSGSLLPMPWAEETLSNYLTKTIRDVIRDEVMNEKKSKGKLYSPPRIFNSLLSSQPLCFNLFGEMQQDLKLASDVLGGISNQRIASVTGIEFEYSPGRGDDRYTGDKSAFDVYVKYETAQGGKGFAGIEVKYHENLEGTAEEHRSRYGEIAEMMGCFNEDCLIELRSQPLQQIWRDHLLAGIHQIQDSLDDGFFVFLYPNNNPHCSSAISDYLDCLSDRESILVWTLQDFCAETKDHTSSEWIDKFQDRYMNFEKVYEEGQAETT